MIKLSVMYPATPGSRFDWDYYLGPHLELARRLLVPRGLVRSEIDKGVSGFPPGSPAPYHAVGNMFFRTRAEMESALAAAADELIADSKKYSEGQAVILVSEVVELPSK